MSQITIEDTPSLVPTEDGSAYVTWVKFTIPKEVADAGAVELMAAEMTGWTRKIPNPAIYIGPAPFIASVPPENMIDNPVTAIMACHQWLWKYVGESFLELAKAQAVKQAQDAVSQKFGSVISTLTK